MTASVFTLPELVSLIASHLTTQDKLHCILACKTFQVSFEPFLFTRLSICDYSYNDHLFATDQDHIRLTRIFGLTKGDQGRIISRNRHRIRSVQVDIFADMFLDLLVSEKTFAETDNNTKHLDTGFNHENEPDGTAPPFPSCTNLTRLVVDVGKLEYSQYWQDLDAELPRLAIHSLLLTNPRLTELGLPGAILMDDPEGQSESILAPLLESIRSGLPLLQKLAFWSPFEQKVDYEPTMALIETVTVERPRFFSQVLQKKDTLVEFLCGFERNSWVAKDQNQDSTASRLSSKGIFRSEASQATTTTIVATSIQKLKLPFTCKHLPLAFLKRILSRERFPDLESFDVPKVAVWESDELGELLATECPKVRQLTGDHVFSVLVDEDEQQSVISALNAYRESGRDLRGQGQEPRGLRSIHLRYYEDLEPVTEAILGHVSTLEEIVFYQTELLESSTVLQFLTRCPNLTRFVLRDRANNLAALQFCDVLGEAGALGTEVGESCEWVCKRLKTLRLVLGRSLKGVESVYEDEVDLEELGLVGGSDKDGSEDENQEQKLGRKVLSLKGLDRIVARKVYAQIGRLTEMEELALWFERGKHSDVCYHGTVGASLPDFSMKVGLPALAGLKKLGHLFLTGEMWKGIGQAEVEFMAKEWPRLERISLDLTVDSLEFLEQIQLPHWRWLKEKRPDVRVGGNGPVKALEPLSDEY